jgi:hypothetical protein
VSGRSRAESQVGVRLMGVWRVSYSNIQEFFFKTAGTWPSPSEELRARSTPDKQAERQKMVRRSGQTSTEPLCHTTFANIQSPELHTQGETIRGPHKRHLYTSSQACDNDGAPPEQVKTTEQTTLRLTPREIYLKFASTDHDTHLPARSQGDGKKKEKAPAKPFPKHTNPLTCAPHYPPPIIPLSPTTHAPAPLCTPRCLTPPLAFQVKAHS